MGKYVQVVTEEAVVIVEELAKFETSEKVFEPNCDLSVLSRK